MLNDFSDLCRGVHSDSQFPPPLLPTICPHQGPHCLCTSEGTYPSRYLSASMAVSMLLTEWAEGRYQHQQGLAGPIILTVGPSLAQVTGGTVEAPATALISQAA